MNEQRRPRRPSPTIVQTLEQSREDLIAGRIDDFDAYLEQLDRRIEQRASEIEAEQRASKPHR